MLDLYLKKKKYSFPNKWEELSPEQYIYLTGLLRSYQLGLLTAEDVRIMYFLKVAGLMPRRFRKAEKEALFSENVYRAAVQLNFFFKYVYTDQKAFGKLDSDLRQRLTKNDPNDLPDEPSIRAARKMKRYIEVNAVFAHNLIPSLPKTNLKGYRFEVKKEFLDTSFTAAQYVDAYSVFEVWSKKNDEESLNLMCAILYQDENYSSERAHKLVPNVCHVSYQVKFAVMLNFMAIHLFLAHNTKYNILFGGSGSDKTGKISLGFHDSIYSLIKAGYGKVEDMNLNKFLDLMLKELIDGVKALHGMDTSLPDIASKTKLTVNQVKSLI
ncbi:MAG: hypothetical protein PF450_16180 [Bacteroidales bacterium]|jgi:hypothetical protein|nr:hypothetical protein [Bacteroidales bacterium]